MCTVFYGVARICFFILCVIKMMMMFELFIDLRIVGLRIRGLQFVGRPTNRNPLTLKPTILTSMNNFGLFL